MSASQLTLSIAASTCSLSSICDADDCDSAASPGGFQLPLRRQEIMLRRHIRSTYGPPAAKSASRPSSWFRSLATHPILTTIVGVAHMVGLHRVVTFVAAASRRSFGSFSDAVFESGDDDSSDEWETKAPPCEDPHSCVPPRPRAEAVLGGPGPRARRIGRGRERLRRAWDYGFFVAITPPSHTVFYGGVFSPQSTPEENSPASAQ